MRRRKTVLPEDIFIVVLSKHRKKVYNKDKDMKHIILASASPRRRELLENLGIKFDVVVSDADESAVPQSLEPGLYVQELALLKAGDVCGKITDKNALIISADTIVYSDGKIMGKPKDKEDASAMLKKLSGISHSVFTGICVMQKSNAYSVCRAVETEVYFKELTDEKIERYVKTGEPMDKAGAYGIQGKGSVLVEKINGDFFNVVGLPVAALAEVLEKEFDIDVFKGEWE